MMIKKILFILGVALAVQTITGCVDCNCGPVRDIYFTQKNLTLRNMDNSLPQPMITNTPKIAVTNYGIHVQLSAEQLALTTPRISWRLLPTAQACSCSDHNYFAKEAILAVEIFSNQDFDANHPKNTDLSLYFKAKRYNSLVTLSDYVKTMKESNNSPVTAFYEGVFLQNPPTISKKHVFKFRITLSDGRILQAETPEVELT